MYFCQINLFVFMLLPPATLMTSAGIIKQNQTQNLIRRKRNFDDTFKQILQSYKVNALKESHIYKNITAKLIFLNQEENKTNPEIDSKENKHFKDISDKIEKILNTIHKFKTNNNNQGTEEKFHLSDSKEETFDLNREIFQTAVKEAINREPIKKDKNNFFNYLYDNDIENEVPNDTLLSENFSQSNTSIPIVDVLAPISIPDRNAIEDTRFIVTERKVESSDVLEEIDNDIEVI